MTIVLDTRITTRLRTIWRRDRTDAAVASAIEAVVYLPYLCLVIGAPIAAVYLGAADELLLGALVGVAGPLAAKAIRQRVNLWTLRATSRFLR